ncbi:MAG: hypothetical protein RMJ53_08140 [Chitinophagales bacterium]|nr:hypothetical protein [Chitinophagales bacterium]
MPKPKKTAFHKFFPAKVLLFGEHTVNLGSRGLAIPTNLFEGCFRFSDLSNHTHAASHRSLELLANYIVFNKSLENLIDIDSLLTHLEEGLYFDSTIPQGYGLGSSGALAAAVLYVFGKGISKMPLVSIKNILAEIEGYFHGKSSGLDALVSYTNMPILIGKQEISAAEIRTDSNNNYLFFLLDSGVARSTSQYVNLFLKKNETASFRSKVEKQIVPVVNICIDALIKNDADTLFKSFALLSQHQLDLLPEFIPEKYIEAWKEGLKKRAYFLKICGAGGGGFLLGLCKKGTDISMFIPNAKIIYLN